MKLQQQLMIFIIHFDHLFNLDKLINHYELLLFVNMKEDEYPIENYLLNNNKLNK